MLIFASFLVKNYIRKKIKSLLKCLIIDFKIKNPKIAVSGLNPHSGEDGKIGLEEKKTIYPVINEFKTKGINISGPYPCDSMFSKKNIKKFDCFITMFHDQALIAFKLLSFDEGVNFTSGLSVVRTSPCHGTAYDLVGKNIAKEDSLLNAIRLANRIYLNRNYDKKIFRPKFS